MVLAELRFIERVLLTGPEREISTWVGNAKQGVALLLEIRLDPHGIRLFDTALRDDSRTGGADTRAAGAGQDHTCGFSGVEHRLIRTAAEAMDLPFKLRADRVGRLSNSGIGHPRNGSA